MMDDKRMQRKRDLHYKVQSNNNSSMAQDLDEIKKLGKEMEHVPTETSYKRKIKLEIRSNNKKIQRTP